MPTPQAAQEITGIVATASRPRGDPFAYLRDVLTRIAATPVSQLDSFLPDRWSANRHPVTPTD